MLKKSINIDINIKFNMAEKRLAAYERLREAKTALEEALRNSMHLDEVQPNIESSCFSSEITLLFVPRGTVQGSGRMILIKNQEKELMRKANYIGENIEEIASRLGLDVKGGCKRLFDYKAPRGYTFKLRKD